MRRIARHIYHIGMILLFVLVAAAGFTQTKMFKAYLLGVLLDEANAFVQGSVWVSSLEGNLITDMRLRDIEIAIDDEELARIEEVHISYDVVGLLLGNIRLSDIEVKRPTVYLYRSTNGTWNLDRFLPVADTEEPDSLTVTPTITIRRFHLEDAAVRMVDSLLLARRVERDEDRPQGAVDYADLDVSGLDIDAGVSVSQMGARLEVQAMSFAMKKHAVTLRNLSGIVELLKASTRVEDLRILTDRSSLQIDASLRKGIGSIGDISDLKGIETRMAFKAQDIDLGELRQFLYPYIEFLDRSANLDLRASGTFDRLSIDRLALRTPESFIQMHGLISHLDHPSDLRLDITGDESVARSDDIRALLSGLTLPSWDGFGDVGFFFSFNGTPLDFDAKIDAQSERGGIQTEGHLKIGTFLTYKGTVRTDDLDIGGFFGSEAPLSRLNAVVDLDGSGTDLSSLITVVRATVDSSRMKGIDVERSVLILDAAQGNISGHVDAMTNVGSFTLSGQSFINSAGEVLRYTAQGSARGVDVAPLAGMDQYASDLNFDLALGGSHAPDGEADSVRLDFMDSRFADHPFQGSVVNIRHVRSGPRRAVTVESVPLTFDITGSYEIPELPTIGAYAVSIVQEHAVRTFGGLDAIRSGPSGKGPATASMKTITAEFDTSDLRIVYEMRSVEPIGALAGLMLTGDAIGTLEMVGSPGDFQVSGRFTSRYFNLDEQGLQLAGKDATLDFFADRTLVGKGMDHTGTSFTVGAHALRLNETLLSSVAVRADVQDTMGMLSVGSLVDSTIHVAGIGTMRRAGSFAEFTFDQLRLEANTYTMQSLDSVVAILGSDGLLFQRAIFGSEDERVSISGIFDPNGVSDMRIALEDFRASHVPDILARSPVAATVAGLSGTLNASLVFRGSFNHPNMRLELTGTDMQLDRIRFGNVDARLGYFERLLTTDISLSVEGPTDHATPDLLLRGSVPYDFSLVETEEDHPLEGDIDLVMISTGIDMQFFEPFLASVTRDLQGSLTCNIRMKGSVNEPLYDGMATIRNAEFLFIPTRMVYQLDGNFLTTGDRIQLQNVVIRNTQDDYANGLMNVTGSISLAGIALRGFDLGFQGELRLMREDSSRLLGNPYYGDLTAATAGQGLNWQGTVERSTLSGQVLIRNAQLTLPPDREGPQFSTKLIDIIRGVDSSGSRARLALEERERAFTVSENTHVTHEPSFIDRIDFDLSLETQGSTQIRFIFNSQANDVLFADLRGRLSFLRGQNSTRLIGDIEVTDRSYYNFLKRFAASGRMLFTGDPLNPELDIVARYQGIHKKAVGEAAAVSANAGPGQTVDERVTVVLYLQGPRNKLDTRFDVEVEDPNSTEGFTNRPGDVEADAIAFIMTGQFRDELTESQRTNLLGQNLGYGLASGLLTGPLSETLRRTTRGSIQSLDVIYYGGDQFKQGADVRVSGQLGEAIYRVGGKVFDNIDNTNVIVEIPLSALLNSNELRNLVLTLERRVEGTESEDQRRSSNEARLQYRIKF